MSASTAPQAGLHAAGFTGTLWAAITLAGGTQRDRHVRAAYDASWLSGLPLPGRP